MLYAWIDPDGRVLLRRDFGGDPPAAKGTGHRWLPVVDAPPEFDPAAELLQRLGETVGEDAVTVDYAVRDLDAEELAAAIADRRRAAYLAAGASSDALIVALWEKLVEGRDAAAEDLQARRLAVKAAHPKD